MTFQKAQKLLGRLGWRATIDEIAAQGYSLSIPLYVKRVTANGIANGETRSLPELWAEWEQEGRGFWQEMDALVEMLEELGKVNK